MSKYESNREFYDDIGSLVALMEQEGLKTEAKKIRCLLHDVAWTTFSELYEELNSEFQ